MYKDILIIDTFVYNSIITYIDNNINLDEFKYSSKVRDKLIITTSELYSHIRYIYFTNEKKRDKNNYVSIPSKAFANFKYKATYKKNIKKMLNYTYFINILKDLDLIHINNYYIVGSTAKDGQSKSYRINDLLESQMTGRYVKDLENTKSYIKYQNTYLELKEKYKDSDLHSNLIDKMFQIEFDSDSYLNHLDVQHSNFIFHNEVYKTKFKTVDFKQIEYKIYLNANNLSIYMKTIQKFVNKNLYYCIQDETGRVTTSITNLEAKAREFLTFNNQKLVEVDLKSAQPCILANLINDTKFYNDVMNNDIYSILSPGNRDKGKSVMFKLLFNKNLRIPKGIQVLYPGLKKELMKLTNDNEICLWSILQRIEAEVMINIIAKDEKVIYTIHDSVAVLEADVDYIKNRIIQEFKNKNINIKVK